MTDDVVFAATLRTMATVSYIYHNIATSGSRGYTIDTILGNLEDMLRLMSDELKKEEGQVTRQQTLHTDEIPF